MGNKLRFEKLLEPGHIGEMDVKNRIVMSPMDNELAPHGGEVSQSLIDYYEERAKGGVGLIIVQCTCVDSPRGKVTHMQLVIDDDKFIPGLNKLVTVVHKHGAKVAIQLHHAGGNTRPEISCLQPVAPSAVPGLPFAAGLPKELTIEEIEGTINRFVEAAERACKAGFDGVEIHGAHGYLVAQFLSAAFNKRRDRYGGNLKNRARFLLEIIVGIRKSLGRSYPLWYRCNGVEYGLEDGITLGQSQKVARLAEESGADAVHVTARDYRDNTIYAANWVVGDKVLPPSAHPPGFLVPLAHGIKKKVNVPVIAIGRITPEIGERVLQEGRADLVAMGRALIADPMLPQKLAAGQSENINPCIACLECRDRVLTGIGIGCTVNAAAGKEREFVVIPATRAKRVMVVGGGPAGMEAARVARLRGHQVWLYEQEHELGGQLLMAGIAPHKEIIKELTKYLTDQVTRLGVNVVLNTEATQELVRDIKPDVLIVATGSSPLIPDISGIDGKNVLTAGDVLENKATVRGQVVVIGGGLVGSETAEFLADRGHKVAIVEMLAEIAVGVGPSTRRILLERLAQKGVIAYLEVSCEQVITEGVVIRNKDGERQTLKADTVVFATGARPNQGIPHYIMDQVPEACLIGDCVEPRRIADAIEDGARAGLL